MTSCKNEKQVSLLALAIVMVMTFSLVACGGSSSVRTNNNSYSYSEFPLTKSNIKDISLDNYRVSGNEIYITQSLVLTNVKSYSSLDVYVKVTYTVTVVLYDGSLLSETFLYVPIVFKGATTKTTFVTMPTGEKIIDVKDINASYYIQSVSGTRYN